jgi:carboxyl-terminal processing protease
MKHSVKFILIFGLFALLISACGAGASPATSAPDVSATQAPTMIPTATKKPTKTPILVGPVATANAMFAQITLNPPTPMGSVAVQGDDDYVGLFNQAWNVIAEKYIRDDFNGVDWDAVYEEYLPLFSAVDNQEDHWALMTDLVHELQDDHSRYVPPDRLGRESKVDTAADPEPVAWTGMQLWPAREDEQLMIWYVCANGPAASAGLVRGDVIQAIDGVLVTKSNDGWEGSDYGAAIYGNEGHASVTLTIQQGPDLEPRDFTIRLGGANGCDDWIYSIVNESPRIGYIRMPAYTGDAYANTLGAIVAMEANGVLDGLILDQRHNPGGQPDQTLTIFTEGFVGTRGGLRSDSTRTIYRIRGPIDWNEDTPVVVLTDGNSASAADWFPAAMKELERATIIGMPSKGNTEGITGFILSDGTYIRLAVSGLLLNDGSSIEGIGVIPDIMVPLGDWGLRQTPYDIQVQAAIDFLLTQ